MRAVAGAAGAPAGAAGGAPQPAGVPLSRPRPPTSPQSMMLARARVHSPTGYRNAGEHPGPHTSPPVSNLRPSGSSPRAAITRVNAPWSRGAPPTPKDGYLLRPG